MGLPDKVINALQTPLSAEYIRLDNDDGISGFVVSRQFEKMSTLDRQQLIDDALRNAPDPLSNEEQREILMIAGLTPDEYESVPEFESTKSRNSTMVHLKCWYMEATRMRRT